jgi:hypothetical protein
LKDILEEKILDTKIEFTLREVLDIAKKDFHELIIDVIKRKRQMIAETLMIKAMDTPTIKTEEEEVVQVSTAILENDTNSEEDDTNSEEDDTNLEEFAIEEITGGAKMKEFEAKAKVIGCKLERDGVKDNKEVKVLACSHNGLGYERNMAFSHPYWARATTETQIKLGEFEEQCIALVDHGSEINIMSKSVYKRGMWPIDIDHGWVIRAANNEKGDLYGACPTVRVKIGDVEVEQNFFVQNSTTYLVILGQPFITATRMETKVLDDGSHYARI